MGRDARTPPLAPASCSSATMRKPRRDVANTSRRFTLSKVCAAYSAYPPPTCSTSHCYQIKLYHTASPTTSSHGSLPSSRAPRPPPAAAAAPGSCCSCARASPLRAAAQRAAAAQTSRPGRVFRPSCSPSWEPAGHLGFHAAANRQAGHPLASVLVTGRIVCNACPSRKFPKTPGANAWSMPTTRR